MEMINLKPSFAKKLNPNGFSPMLLALRSAQTKLVLRLLKTDKDLVRVKGWEGMTPFHYVVTTGNSRLLINFLEACPECIEDVTVRDETALHLALKEDQNEAFNLLIGWLQRTRSTHGSVFSFEKKMANWKDDQDNSLHSDLLLDSQLWLHVKAKDSKGLTALEIIKDANRRGVSTSTSDEVDTKIKRLKVRVTFERIRVLGDRTRHNMSVDMINTMLVIMALVITAIYQSSLRPPGSVWQDNDTAPAPAPSNITHHLSNKNIFNTSISIFGEKSGKAGKTIMNPNIYDEWIVLVLEPCNLRVHGSCNRVLPLQFSPFPAPCRASLYVGHLLLLFHDDISANPHLGILNLFFLLLSGASSHNNSSVFPRCCSSIGHRVLLETYGGRHVLLETYDDHSRDQVSNTDAGSSWHEL
ncbi:hypothetical protein F3Y22_tig00110546pilonHSYRG00049 [Hibiscus syriacus]|uniref:Uncharacterized protein n=1 Tax=Hibiscus syriacus TaxID=106335 RepID=A0A6A3AC21_HIBSY|nr:hypothetical protein F3Y22_tig00110546pilonHSYRG00049 [Hibiscus syriacus]